MGKKVYELKCHFCEKKIRTITDPQGMRVTCGCKQFKKNDK